MSDRDSSPEGNEFTKNLKSSKGKKPKPEQKDLEEAVPAHILRLIQMSLKLFLYIKNLKCLFRIVQGVEERRKLKDVQEKRRQESLDSMGIFRFFRTMFT